MSNPTSNFNWQMPTSTDLVTDLPADFEVFGQAVDTSLADLKGGTTGQILSKATNADMDFTWVTSAGDIEGVTAGIGISGGGTTGTVTITNSMATAIDAKADLIAGTGADTFSRLAVGSNGTVLTADSAEATGLKWATPAGSLTTLASGSLSSTSLTISSISGSYTHLQLVIRDFKSTVDGTSMRLRFNGDSGTRYKRVTVYGNSGVVAFDETSIQYSAGNSSTNADGLTVLNVLDYANTSTFKVCDYLSIGNEDGAGTGTQNHVGYGIYNQIAAITSMTIVSGGGTMSGTYTLYGVK
jgi:hypothetical protein